MQNKLKFLDHTGDTGIQVWGDSLEDIFSIAAKGMFYVISESENIKSETEYPISLQADSNSELVVFWLSELNFLFATEGMLLSQVDQISVQDGRLEAVVTGEIFSPEKHEILREIKAVTYHQLILEQKNEGWFAQVIFDL